MIKKMKENNKINFHFPYMYFLKEKKRNDIHSTMHIIQKKEQDILKNIHPSFSRIISHLIFFSSKIYNRKLLLNTFRFHFQECCD